MRGKLVLAALVMPGWFAASSPAAVAAAWTIQPSPNPIAVKTDTLLGVSCSSPTDCMAVGYDQGSVSVSSGPLVEHWDGNSWSIQQVPNPGGWQPTLSGVSCTSASFCMAVGQWIDSAGRTEALAERWDGTSWSLQLPAVVPGAARIVPREVSCASATACTAIGFSNDSSGQHLLVERWDGSGWSSQSIPEPTGLTAGDALSGISCPSDNVCVAVGHYTPDSSGHLRQLVERWDGSSWSIDSLPDPGGISSSLSGVSCGSATACTVVGTSSVPTQSAGLPGGLPQPLIESWDGSSWSIAPSPAFAGSVSALSLVSCPSPTGCVAVGYTNGSSGELLTERWDGTSWTIEPAPAPDIFGLTGGAVRDLSCPSATACTAVALAPSPLASHSVAASWDGANWSNRPTPYISDVPDGTLVAVSCSSPVSCTSIGSYDKYIFNALPLMEAWDGTSWSIKPTSASSFAIPNAPVVLSCSSPRACTGVWGGGLEHWDGTGWSSQQPASPTAGSPVPTLYSDIALSGVSCQSATACTAVGGYHVFVQTGLGGGVEGPDLPLAERWNGRRWSVQSTPIPAGAAGAQLNVVSCGSRISCVAIGTYSTWAGRQLMFAERWNGKNWSIQPSPATIGPSTSLSGLSCASPTTCVAVGSYRARTGHRLALAERWSGTRWSIAPLPMPAAATTDQLVAVSCATGGACTAIGSYRNAAGAQLVLVERWGGGGAWSIQPTPSPAGGALTDVSCASATTCTAVGSYRSGLGQQRLTLVERWS
jgi:hypothetical protein